MNEEKTIIKYQKELQLKEVKEFKEATTNYFILEYIDDLEKENERLKTRIDEISRISVADHKYASQKEDEAIDLQEKIRTAVEYIKNGYLVNTKELLKILGVEDE